MSQTTEEAVNYFRRNICVNCSLEDDCNGDADCLACKAFVEGITMLENELKEANEKLSDIIEIFVSRSYTDDFEMMNAGREIYELFYPDKKSYREE